MRHKRTWYTKDDIRTSLVLEHPNEESYTEGCLTPYAEGPYTEDCLEEYAKDPTYQNIKSLKVITVDYCSLKGVKGFQKLETLEIENYDVTFYKDQDGSELFSQLKNLPIFELFLLLYPYLIKTSFYAEVFFMRLVLRSRDVISISILFFPLISPKSSVSF